MTKTRHEHYYNNIYKTGSNPQENVRGKIAGLTDYRREQLAAERQEKHTITAVSAKSSLIKNAQVVSNTGYKGSGDTLMQSPEIYSPLWLNSNMSLPRDRPTINAWCRLFYAMNPFVQNAISLHSTYPISKLNIKCKNKEVENFFNEMIEETNLENICIQIAQQYYLLGEAWIYNEFDKNKGRWSRFVLQNPDYMVPIPGANPDNPQIFMRPDEHLKKICTSNNPKDIELRKQFDPYIVEAMRRGGNNPMERYNNSLLAKKNTPQK